jgi:hypothetical protein
MSDYLFWWLVFSLCGTAAAILLVKGGGLDE